MWYKIMSFCLFLCIFACSPQPNSDNTQESNAIGNESSDPLQKLLDGNKRFVEGKTISPRSDVARIKELVNNENPFAVIVSCSDSRVTPEILFDQGLGDLFCIRTAGNVIDDIAIGSIEYAVEHLGVGLVVVLSHENCGAVKAFVQSQGEHKHDHIGAIVDEISAGMKFEKLKSKADTSLDNYVKANALYVSDELKITKPFIKQAFDTHTLKIVAARYDLDNGEVTLLE